MLVALMTAFTFTSCEDVPAPYDIPNGGNGGGSTEMTGNGTAENPYTVEDIKQSGATGSNVYVKAYIVGYVPGKAIDEAKFTAEGCEATSNVLIAASADETSVDNVMPVQLPVGDVRDAINLKDNPANLKQEVVLCGNIEAYFGKTGLKSVAWGKLGDKEFGAKPGTETGGGTETTGTPKGDGSKENPFNSVAANQMASKLASGAKTDKQYYIKGKVVSVKEAFSAQFGNASFYISDDGKEDNKFYVFRTLYLNNEKWTEGNTNVAVGDEVVVCGSLINYMGNTPETVQGETYLVSLKSNGGGTETPDTPDTPEVAEGLTLDTTNGIVTMKNAGVEEGSSIEVSVEEMNLEGDEAAGTPITSITLSDGTKIEFDGGGETNKPTYFKKYQSIRVYKNNGFTVTGKSKIAKIVFTCDGAQNVGNKTATLTFSGNTATYKNVYTETKGGGVQFRFKSVKIVYAK